MRKIHCNNFLTVFIKSLENCFLNMWSDWTLELNMCRRDTIHPYRKTKKKKKTLVALWACLRDRKPKKADHFWFDAISCWFITSNYLHNYHKLFICFIFRFVFSRFFGFCFGSDSITNRHLSHWPHKQGTWHVLCCDRDARAIECVRAHQQRERKRARAHRIKKIFDTINV